MLQRRFEARQTESGEAKRESVISETPYGAVETKAKLRVGVNTEVTGESTQEDRQEEGFTAPFVSPLNSGQRDAEGAEDGSVLRSVSLGN